MGVATHFDALPVALSGRRWTRAPMTFQSRRDSETIMGTSGNTVIYAFGGNDLIDGLGGNNILCRGLGNDTRRGNTGNNILRGEIGTDTCDGDTGSGDTANACETVTNVP
ncbi:MAG TPA: hypothetical protein VIH59_06845 [Candidatus Tectomicrobia bacterium]